MFIVFSALYYFTRLLRLRKEEIIRYNEMILRQKVDNPPVSFD
jgi:hypothetical protein